MRRRGKRFNFDLGMERLKVTLGKYRGTGFRVREYSSGVSISELLNWEKVLYTVVLGLVSDSMLVMMKCYDEVTEVGDDGEVVLKVGWVRLIDGGIQFGGSSWAKKMVILRTKFSGMWLFCNLFVCVVFIELLVYYMLDWALWRI